MGNFKLSNGFFMVGEEILTINDKPKSLLLELIHDTKNIVSDVNGIVAGDFVKNNVERSSLLGVIEQYKDLLTIFSIILVIILIFSASIIISVAAGHKTNVPILDSMPVVGLLLGMSVLLLIVTNRLGGVGKISCISRAFDNKSKRTISSVKLLNSLEFSIRGLQEKTDLNESRISVTIDGHNKKCYDLDGYKREHIIIRKKGYHTSSCMISDIKESASIIDKKLLSDHLLFTRDSGNLLRRIKRYECLYLVFAIIMSIIFIIAFLGMMYYFLCRDNTDMWLLMSSPLIAMFSAISTVFFSVETLLLVKAQKIFSGITERTSIISSNMHHVLPKIDEIKKILTFGNLI